MASVEAVARENGAAITALGTGRHRRLPGRRRAHAAVARAGRRARRTSTFALQGAADVRRDGRLARRPLGASRLQTPAGAASFALRRRRPAQRAQRARRDGLRARRRRSARGDRARPRELRAGQRALAGASAARAPAARVTLVDDTYNANPDSVRAAIDVLAALPAPRWLVLGDMGEVGDQGPSSTPRSAPMRSERGIEMLWTAGALARRTAPPPTARRATSPTSPALIAALAGRAGRAPRCWSRARAS